MSDICADVYAASDMLRANVNGAFSCTFEQYAAMRTHTAKWTVAGNELK